MLSLVNLEATEYMMMAKQQNTVTQNKTWSVTQFKISLTPHPSHIGGNGFFGRWIIVATLRRPSASDTAADYNHKYRWWFTSPKVHWSEGSL